MKNPLSIYNNMVWRQPMKRLVMLTLALCLPLMAVMAQLGDKYTSRRPLTIAVDGEHSPYYFTEEDGHQKGYVVDVLQHIFSQMRLPHQFEVVPAQEALGLLMMGRVDLVAVTEDELGLYMQQGDSTVVVLRTVMGYFTKEDADSTALPVKIRIVSHDRELIDQMDELLARFSQSGRLEDIRQQWLFPERLVHNASPIAIYSVLAVLILAAALFALLRWQRMKVKTAMTENDDLQIMMKKALELSQYDVMVYNVKNDSFTNSNGHFLPHDGMTMNEFISHLHPEEREHATNELEQLMNANALVSQMTCRWNDREAGELPNWRFMRGHSFAEKNDDGMTRSIVITMKDITTEVLREQKDGELAGRFASIFNSTLVAMSFYSPDGHLIDLNEKMRELCQFSSPESEKFFREINIFDLPLFRDDFDRRSRDDMHVCQRMRYADGKIDKYIEFRICPVYDGDNLIYYTITARDVTDERAMYLAQRQKEKELSDANQQISEYEAELHYLLENSQMWVWRSHLDSRLITYSRSLRQQEVSMTFEEYMEGLYPDQIPIAMKAFQNLEGSDSNFNITLHFRYTSVSDKPMWTAISGIPEYDGNGRLTGHFGVVRDVTTLMETQELLRKETARAEDSGKLKSVFLANMTHEIRTPLNAIVGFSDLLPMIQGSDDKREVIRIIRNNCDMLIRLIDDIIEASNMNQGPIAIEPTVVDFSPVFNDICQVLAQRVQEPGVQFQVDNPFKTFPAFVDKGRMQQVITNFTTNAVKYTHQGHIRVGYRTMAESELPLASTVTKQSNRHGLYMYCEDTGAGIPKEKQASVFERFVKLNDYIQGTGLGLSICKTIADRCDGHIGVISEGEGHGSTFWIWIPQEDSLQSETL